MPQTLLQRWVFTENNGSSCLTNFGCTVGIHNHPPYRTQKDKRGLKQRNRFGTVKKFKIDICHNYYLDVLKVKLCYWTAPTYLVITQLYCFKDSYFSIFLSLQLFFSNRRRGKMCIILKQRLNREAATIDWKKMEYRFVLVDKWVTYVAHTANQYITLCWLRLHTVILI